MIGFVGLGQRSSLEYVSKLHKLWRSKHGGRSSCPLVMLSPDFEEVATLQQRDDWNALDSLMVDWARKIAVVWRHLLGYRRQHDAQKCPTSTKGPPSYTYC